jgi:hypothetical protein
VAKLQEEVTRALAAVVMAETRAASKERMAQERVVLLAPARDKADEVDQRVSALEDELMAMRWGRDVAEEKFLSLSAKAAAAEWRRVAAKE